MHFRFEKVIEEAAKQVFGRMSEQARAEVGRAVDGRAVAAAAAIERLRQLLLGPWAAAQASQLPCAVLFRGTDGRRLSCTEPMIGRCTICRQPACLAHAMVSLASGDFICLGCVEGARQGRAAAPAEPSAAALRDKYLRLLKLSGRPSETQIRAAFRREAAKAHPDRASGEKDKQRAHKRFVDLGRARDWLIADLKREAA